MLFNSIAFIFIFLPVVTVLYFLIARTSHSIALCFLLASSLVFYSYSDWRYLAVLVPSIIFNYIVGLQLSKIRKSNINRILLSFGIGVDLCVLFFYKYLDFAIGSLDALGLAHFGLQSIPLPLGISFFTFTQIAFLVDAAQDKVREPKFINFALFVSYFPHLIAGPILHHKEMMPQFSLRSTFKISAENLSVGLAIFSMGLFKKVILADGIAPHVHTIFDAASRGANLSTLEAWSGALFYALQIYFDFSGYSDMAIGLSRLFGILLPVNFNSPYKATNFIDFWRRWHMTLSRFLRDYLYIPLGGNRKGEARRFANLICVMILGGLWHGANWTFVIWGTLHGVYLAVNHLSRLAFGELSDRWPSRIAGQFFTFLLTTFAWVFFRANNVNSALLLVRGMIGLNGTPLPSISPPSQWLNELLGAPSQINAEFLLPNLDVLLLGVLMLAIAWFCPNTQEIMVDYRPTLFSRVRRIPSYFRWRPNWIYALLVSVIAFSSLVVIVYQKRVGDFIYFQF